MIWVLTCEYNDYNQYGEYYIKAWDHLPSYDELKIQLEEQLGGNALSNTIHHLLDKGGGRIKNEDCWWWLRED